MKIRIDFSLEGAGVYAILNRYTGQEYIGSTTSFSRRMREHMDMLSEGIHHSYKLQNAFNAFPADAFRFIILERCAVSELRVREQYYIDYHMSAIIGYNVNPSATEKMPVRINTGWGTWRWE
jgi:group I intron endonuclease